MAKNFLNLLKFEVEFNKNSKLSSKTSKITLSMFENNFEKNLKSTLKILNFHLSIV